MSNDGFRYEYLEKRAEIMTGKEGIEQRRFGRRESTIHAVVMAGGRPQAHCIVRNYSDRGALIELKETGTLPYRFRLVVESKGVDVLCEVRHQGPYGIGVQFVGGSAAGLVETSQHVRAAPGELPRLSEQPKPVARVSGADLRSSLFGRQLDPPKEVVKQ